VSDPTLAQGQSFIFDQTGRSLPAAALIRLGGNPETLNVAAS